MQQIIAFVMAVIAFFQGLFGIRKLCYGGKEVLVLTDQRDAIVNAYRNAGAAYTLIEYPNSYHGLESDPDSEALFRQTLKQYFTTYVGY